MAKTAAKGTKDNPYSMSECEKMLDAGTWPGGYVRDDAGTVSYVMKSVTVQGYSGSPDFVIAYPKNLHQRV